MRNIVTRTITGSVYVALVIASVIIHPLFLVLFSLLLNCIALLEFGNIKKKLGGMSNITTIWLNNLIFILSLLLLLTRLPLLFQLIPLMLFPLVFLTYSLFSRQEKVFQHSSSLMFEVSYITLPLISLNMLQKISFESAMPYVLFMFILIWTNDTFAYLSGIAFGKHKMFVRISPRKSWEGFAGGMIMVLIASGIIFHFYPVQGIIFWLIFGFIVSIASVTGDFVESWLKRLADIKDSGTFLPGHGGILDRIDSLLFAAPLIFIYILIMRNF